MYKYNIKYKKEVINYFLYKAKASGFKNKKINKVKEFGKYDGWLFTKNIAYYKINRWDLVSVK
jgi:hypothetical protein